MTLTFLGTGTSQGVPMIGCPCPVCHSTDPRDNRTRSSVLIQRDGFAVLIDTTPDLRAQAIRENLRRVDAVIITHPHADHIMGFDDLRRFCEMTRRNMPVYASRETFVRLHEIFGYAFDENNKVSGYLHADAHEINGPFQLGGIEFTPLPLPHGSLTTLGFLIAQNGEKRAAYLNDCGSVPDDVLRAIEETPVLIIDGLRDGPHPSHLTIAQAVAVGQRARAGKTYLIHLTHDKSHVERQKEMPKNCFISYDGLKLEL
ncbi:MAG: MBL fold metallo-hydrolase [bacterium]